VTGLEKISNSWTQIIHNRKLRLLERLYPEEAYKSFAVSNAPIEKPIFETTGSAEATQLTEALRKAYGVKQGRGSFISGDCKNLHQRAEGNL
jgi:hypothetical protein